MASINFPIVNNKEIEYPLKPDMKTVFPTYYSGDSLKVAAYSPVRNSDPTKAADGWSYDVSKDTIWIGKDVESFTFKYIQTTGTVRHEIASIAFEDGRTDLSNIFFMGYHMDGNEEVDDEEHKEEFSDMSALPFRINTSVRLPKTMNDLPGITLEAPYNYQGNEWSCDVVLSNPYFTGFVIHGGSASGMSDDLGVIQINDGDGRFFSLNSENGTVNIYFPNITLDTLSERDSDSTVFLINNGITAYDIHCNLRFFLVDEVYEDLKSHEYWTDSQANEAGYYKLETQKMTGLESKVKDVIADSREDILEVTSDDIDEMMGAPLIDILDIRARSTDGLNPFQIKGVFSVTDQETSEVKYVDFVWNSGTMTAYLMDENREPDTQADTDVSSEVTIAPLGTTTGVPYVPVVSFRGGVDSTECPIGTEK